MIYLVERKLPNCSFASRLLGGSNKCNVFVTFLFTMFGDKLIMVLFSGLDTLFIRVFITFNTVTKNPVDHIYIYYD